MVAAPNRTLSEPLPQACCAVLCCAAAAWLGWALRYTALCYSGQPAPTGGHSAMPAGTVRTGTGAGTGAGTGKGTSAGTGTGSGAASLTLAPA